MSNHSTSANSSGRRCATNLIAITLCVGLTSVAVMAAGLMISVDMMKTRAIFHARNCSDEAQTPLEFFKILVGQWHAKDEGALRHALLAPCSRNSPSLSVSSAADSA